MPRGMEIIANVPIAQGAIVPATELPTGDYDGVLVALFLNVGAAATPSILFQHQFGDGTYFDAFQFAAFAGAQTGFLYMTFGFSSPLAEVDKNAAPQNPNLFARVHFPYVPAALKWSGAAVPNVGYSFYVVGFNDP